MGEREWKCFVEYFACGIFCILVVVVAVVVVVVPEFCIVVVVDVHLFERRLSGHREWFFCKNCWSPSIVFCEKWVQEFGWMLFGVLFCDDNLTVLSDCDLVVWERESGSALLNNLLADFFVSSLSSSLL